MACPVPKLLMNPPLPISQQTTNKLRVYELDNALRFSGRHPDNDRVHSPTCQNLEVKISKGSFPRNVANFFPRRFVVAGLWNFATRLAGHRCQLCHASSDYSQFGAEVAARLGVRLMTRTENKGACQNQF